MKSWATIGDGHIAIACILSAPAGANWCGIDLEPGRTIVYGRGAEHTAVNPVGTRVVFGLADEERLAELAERRRLRFERPEPGQVHFLKPGHRGRGFGSRLSTFLDAAVSGTDSLEDRELRILNAMTTILSDDRHAARIGAGRKIDSRYITRRCIEHAEATVRMPSVAEMCLVAHVSERRLRYAFKEIYDAPPVEFFRVWAMNGARRRLRHADPQRETVTNVALGFGFGHLGRFATGYREFFGEAPSTTLRRSA